MEDGEGIVILSEYIQRKRLAKIGYFEPMSDLSAFKADCFAFIDAEIDRLQDEDAKKKRARRHGK